MPRVNITDIARKAGVSKTAVSFAFNNPSRLSEATVQQILAIAEEMGYSPDPVARSMSTGRTGTIGLLLPQPLPEIVRNPYFPEFLEGIGEVCTHSGLSLMLVPPLKGSMRRAIVNAAVDGFLTLGLEESKATMVVLRQRGVPFVTVDSDPIEGVPAINVDDAGGACQAMQHVLALGHRQIAILAIRSGKQGHYREYVGTLGARMHGYLQALEEYGLTINGRSVRLLECASTEEGGMESFQTLWKSRHHPTAIIAMSDIIAIGVIKAAASAGQQVPRDLSVVGFDDITLASLIHPALTTVAQPSREKGEMATRELVKLIESNSQPIHQVLPTRLVERSSVCPPPKNED
ncbi:transcriptional regulator, LacI family [Longilinea arvoryzae]|uniref:Transcriptional regulator, LacI family n=1 Tax=Longilinea arvoryzae TaxID=360412 RepID=A0A0S7BGB9_9CHLR|nr:LacI family DNA-binding transcriptional regulator [Longilinea arvoryzae]GAP12490.1 transcriptional regulator, LacI family [Longilinea arvoryzae]